MEFMRIIWASDESRTTWEHRLTRITMAWQTIEQLSVREGVRKLAIANIASTELDTFSMSALRRGLVVLPFDRRATGQGYSARASSPKAGAAYNVACGLSLPQNALENWQVLERGDTHVTGSALGYPQCCVKFFQEYWERLRLIDTTWAMCGEQPTRECSVDGTSLANPLWRWLGVRAISHLPCSFQCAQSIDIARSNIDLGSADGFVEEMQWLQDLLLMPVEWSARNQIAEIRYPMARLSVRSIETEDTLTVRYSGNGVMPDGPKGLRFPYNLRAGSPRNATAKLRRKGADEDMTVDSREWTDNGFSSTDAMQLAHERLTRSIMHRSIATTVSAVADIGCGNGILLDMLSRQLPSVTTCAGIECDANKVESARVRLQHKDAHIAWGDFQRYPQCFELIPDADLLLLMPGRLIECTPEQRAVLLAQITRKAKTIVAYAYGDWLTSFGSLEKLCHAADLAVIHCDEVTAVVTPVVAGAREVGWSPGEIDWSRMAEPQSDGYDTIVTNELRRSESGRSVIRGHARPVNALPITHMPKLADVKLAFVSGTHPVVQRGLNLLSSWSLGRQQVMALIDSVQTGCQPDRVKDGILGTACGSSSETLTVVQSVADSRVGFAEGIVHELGHQKLRTLGVAFESAARLLGPDNSPRFPSPIRMDKLRPLSAVLHAQYSYTYVLALYCAILDSDADPEAQHALINDRLPYILPRMRFGMSVLDTELFNVDGRSFTSALHKWTGRLIDHCAAVLSRHDVKEKPFTHPLTTQPLAS